MSQHLIAIVAFYAHLWHQPIRSDGAGTLWVQARGLVYGIAHLRHGWVPYFQERFAHSLTRSH